MGGVRLIAPPPETDGRVDTDSPVKYREIFDKVFPYYLSIGMTYEQFYFGDCTLVKAYRKAQELREERRNRELWWQGLYIYEALGDISPVLHAFAKPGTKALPYPSEPYPTTEKEIELRKEQKARKEYEENLARMQAFMKRTNEKNQEVAKDG